MKCSLLFAAAILMAGSAQISRAQHTYRIRGSRERGRDYALFTLTSAYVPMYMAGSDSHISFTYSYLDLPGSYTYNSALQIPALSSYTSITSFGGEFGRMNGISALLVAGGSSTSQTTLHHYEFAVGYNLKLGSLFTLHPSVGWSTIDTEADFPDGIDNKDKDVLALGQTYKYHTSYHTRYGTHDIYSDYTNVSLEAYKNGIVLQCELRTSPLKRLVAGISAGCGFYDHEKLKVMVYNGSNHPEFNYDNPSLQFRSNVSPRHYFDYSGFYCRFTISYCYVRDPDPQKRWIRKRNR